MINITGKPDTLRVAEAVATLVLSPGTIKLVKQDKIPKGNPLEVARVAAVQAVKNTSQIIPYCHPLPILGTEVSFTMNNDRIKVNVKVNTVYKTGVEMEALTGVSVAVLTLYDMLKTVDGSMFIRDIRLIEKKGGVSTSC